MRINEVSLAGRLGQDPRIAYLPSGIPAVDFSLATDESYKDRDGNKVARAEWHRVKLFGSSAEFAGKYLSKGQQVFVRGHLRTRSWEDDQGQRRFMTEVVVSGPRDFIQPIEWREPGQSPQPGSDPMSASQGEEPLDGDVPF